MDVSVIIVNYNTKDLTSSCIESIFSMTNGITFEVILVDNGSTDGSKELFEHDQRINYIYNQENIGFGRANNHGYKYATGKYMFFLNSDTELLNNAIYEMYCHMEQADDNVACVGCLLTGKDNEQMFSYGRFPSVKSYALDLLLYYHIRINCFTDKPFPSAVYPLTVDYVVGADLFMRRQAIEACGLFDPEYFMYYEETDMQYRYKQHGYLSQIISSPHIIHYQGASNKRTPHKRSLRMACIGIKSSLRYANKHFGKAGKMSVAFLHLLMIPKILLYRVSWCEKCEEIKLIISNFNSI